MQVTGSALDFKSAADKVARALLETRIRGIKTNIPFIRNVLIHPQFISGEATTSFIGDSPELFDFAVVENRGQKLLNYLGELVVNGRSSWYKVPSALFEDTAPSVRLVAPRAQAAPTHPRAPPEQLGGSP